MKLSGIAKFTWLALLACACADGTAASEDEADAAASTPTPVCANGYSVGPDGAGCTIPEIAPGEVETPDEPFEEPQLDNSDIEEARNFFLNQEGDGKFRVYVGETVQIGIRAVEYSGQPAVGHRIAFELVESNPSGASLGALQADTNEFGVASINVTAGPRPAFFKIKMSANETLGLTYDVNVVLPPEGREPGAMDPPPVEPGEFGANCQLDVQGGYRVTNRYEPARLIGDGFANALQQVNDALSDPGDFVGDLIRDRIDGIWGAVVRAAVRPVVNYLYDYIVSNYAPDWVQWMLILTEDITSILVELEIEGTMELGGADAQCALGGIHKWEKLVLFWRAGCEAGNAQCGRYEVPLNQLGIAASESPFQARITRNLGPVADLAIDPHELRLNIGVVIVWFIQNVILPQRLDADSFGDVLQLVLPCDAVGDLAAQYVGGSVIGFAVAPFVEEACEAAMEAAGNYLTRLIADSLSVDTFSMSGTCRLRDTDGDTRADRIEDGLWSDGLGGDFTGERIR